MVFWRCFWCNSPTFNWEPSLPWRLRAILVTFGAPGRDEFPGSGWWVGGLDRSTVRKMDGDWCFSYWFDEVLRVLGSYSLTKWNGSLDKICCNMCVGLLHCCFCGLLLCLFSLQKLHRSITWWNRVWVKTPRLCLHAEHLSWRYGDPLGEWRDWTIGLWFEMIGSSKRTWQYKILLMEEILHQLRLVAYLMIYRVFYIPADAGFLNHQQHGPFAVVVMLTNMAFFRCKRMWRHWFVEVFSNLVKCQVSFKPVRWSRNFLNILTEVYFLERWQKILIHQRMLTISFFNLQALPVAMFSFLTGKFGFPHFPRGSWLFQNIYIPVLANRWGLNFKGLLNGIHLATLWESRCQNN